MRKKPRLITLLTVLLFSGWGISYLFLRDSLDGPRLFAFILIPFLVIILTVAIALIAGFSQQEKQDARDFERKQTAIRDSVIKRPVEKTYTPHKSLPNGAMYAITTACVLTGAAALILWGPALYHAFFAWLDSIIVLVNS